MKPQIDFLTAFYDAHSDERLASYQTKGGLDNRQTVISKQLNHIRNLRNRIFHYELWYWKDLTEQHQMLYALIGWIQPHLCDYLQYNFTIQLLINTSIKQE